MDMIREANAGGLAFFTWPLLIFILLLSLWLCVLNGNSSKWHTSYEPLWVWMQQEQSMKSKSPSFEPQKGNTPSQGSVCVCVRAQLASKLSRRASFHRTRPLIRRQKTGLWGRPLSEDANLPFYMAFLSLRFLQQQVSPGLIVLSGQKKWNWKKIVKIRNAGKYMDTQMWKLRDK